MIEERGGRVDVAKVISELHNKQELTAAAANKVAQLSAASRHSIEHEDDLPPQSSSSASGDQPQSTEDGADNGGPDQQADETTAKQKQQQIRTTGGFRAPEKQISKLEQTSQKLHEINTRVISLVHDYEAEADHEDEIFQSTQSTSITDQQQQKTDGQQQTPLPIGKLDVKQILNQSKGKVQLLVVDYGKLCMDRQEVLDSLRQWFSLASQDNTFDLSADDDNDESTDQQQNNDAMTVNSILANTADAKERLSSLHDELLDMCSRQVKTAQNVAADAAFTTAERDQLIAEKQKLLDDLKVTVNRLREAEARAGGLQKALEKKTDELKLTRTKEDTEAAGIKQELHEATQKHREKEVEMIAEIDELKKRLEKTKERLDKAVVDSMAANGSNTNSSSKGNQQLSPHKMGEKSASSVALEAEMGEKEKQWEKEKQELEGRVATMERQMKGQELMFQQEMTAARQKAEEDAMGRLSKQKMQYERLMQRVKDDQSQHNKDLESLAQQQQTKTTTNNASSGKEGGEGKDFQSIIDSVQGSFNERLATMKETMAKEFAIEKEEMRKEYQMKEVELKNEMAMRLQQAQATWQRQLKSQNENMDKQLSAMPTAEEIMALSASSETKDVRLMKLTVEMTELAEKCASMKQELDKKETMLKQVTEKYDRVNIRLNELKYKDYPSSTTDDDNTEQRRQQQPKEMNEAMEQIRILQETTQQQAAELTMLTTKLIGTGINPLSLSGGGGGGSSARTPGGSMRGTEMRTTYLAREEADRLIKEAKREADIIKNREIAKLRNQLATERASTIQQMTETFEGEKSEWKDKIEYLMKCLKTTSTTMSSTSPASPSTLSLQAQQQEDVAVLTKATKKIDQLKERLEQEQQKKKAIQLGLETAHAEDMDEVEKSIMNLQREIQTEESLRDQTIMMQSRAGSAMRRSIGSAASVQSNDNNNTSAGGDEQQREGMLLEVAAEVPMMMLQIQKLERENRALKSATKHSSTTTTGGGDVLEEGREEMLAETLKNEAELKAKVTLLEKSITTKEETEQSLQQQIEDQKKLIEELELRITNKSSNATTTTSVKEREEMTEEINKLTTALEEQTQAAQQERTTLKEEMDTELGQMKARHEAFVKELTENYERRIAGLTRALTASLEDHELVNELQKENEAKLANRDIVHQNTLETVKLEMKKLEDEHQESIRQLNEEDQAQVGKMHQLLGKLRGQCLVLMDDVGGDGLDDSGFDCTCDSGDPDSCPTHGIDAMKLKQNAQQQPGEEEVTYEIIPTPSTQPTTPQTTTAATTTTTTGGGMIAVTLTNPSTPTAATTTLTGGVQRKSFMKSRPASNQQQVNMKINKEMKDLERIYNTMTTVVKDGKSKLTDQQSGRIIELQKDIIKAREIITTQQKKLSQFETASAQADYNTSLQLADTQAKLQEQYQTIVQLKKQYEVQRDRLVQYREEKGIMQANVETLQSDAHTKTMVIEDLKQQLALAKKHLEVAEAQQRLNLGRTGYQAAALAASSTTYILSQQGPGQGQQQQQPTSTLAQLVQRGAKVSVAKLKQLEEAVYGFDERTLDEEGRRKKQEALALFERDRDLRQQRLGLIFTKLKEKKKLADMQAKVAADPHNDKLAAVLRRMQERYETSMKEWERKKQQLLEIRRRHLILVMQAFSEFVIYKSLPGARQLDVVHGTMRPMLHSSMGWKAAASGLMAVTSNPSGGGGSSLYGGGDMTERGSVVFGRVSSAPGGVRERVYPPKSQARMVPMIPKPSVPDWVQETPLSLMGTAVNIEHQQPSSSSMSFGSSASKHGFGARPPPVLSGEFTGSGHQSSKDVANAIGADLLLLNDADEEGGADDTMIDPQSLAAAAAIDVEDLGMDDTDLAEALAQIKVSPPPTASTSQQQQQLIKPKPITMPPLVTRQPLSPSAFRKQTTNNADQQQPLVLPPLVPPAVTESSSRPTTQ